MKSSYRENLEICINKMTQLHVKAGSKLLANEMNMKLHFLSFQFDVFRSMILKGDYD